MSLQLTYLSKYGNIHYSAEGELSVHFGLGWPRIHFLLLFAGPVRELIVRLRKMPTQANVKGLIMKNQMVFAPVLLVLACELVGCAVYRDTYTSGWKVQTYDNEMYVARSRHRHQAVEPIQPGEQAAVLVEDAQAEIFDQDGYKNGLVCVFVNDSRHELRLVIDDPHKQQFTLRIPATRREYDRSTRTYSTIPGWQELNLEQGLHRIRAFRDGRDTPYAVGEFRVRSDKSYHVEVGQMHYFGGGRFGD